MLFHGPSVTRLLEQRDERRAARLALGKRRGGLDLGQHGAATELVVYNQPYRQNIQKLK